MRAPGASIATSWTSRRPLLLVVLIGLLLAGRVKIGIVGGRDAAALAAPRSPDGS